MSLSPGRTAEKINAVSHAITSSGGAATGVVTDTTKESDVIRLFDTAEKAGPGPLDVVIYNAGNNFMKDILDMEAEFFENVWRVGCFGGFLVGREAGRRMIPRGQGTLLFTGATGSLRGKPPFGSFAAAKAGLRALCQTMARDWGPKGIHVAHVIIDGGRQRRYDPLALSGLPQKKRRGRHAEYRRNRRRLLVSAYSTPNRLVTGS